MAIEKSLSLPSIISNTTLLGIAKIAAVSALHNTFCHHLYLSIKRNSIGICCNTAIWGGAGQSEPFSKRGQPSSWFWTWGIPGVIPLCPWRRFRARLTNSQRTLVGTRRANTQVLTRDWQRTCWRPRQQDSDKRKFQCGDNVGIKGGQKGEHVGMSIELTAIPDAS
jgi:hypothetical protein